MYKRYKINATTGIEISTIKNKENPDGDDDGDDGCVLSFTVGDGVGAIDKSLLSSNRRHLVVVIVDGAIILLALWMLLSCNDRIEASMLILIYLSIYFASARDGRVLFYNMYYAIIIVLTGIPVYTLKRYHSITVRKQVHITWSFHVFCKIFVSYVGFSRVSF